MALAQEQLAGATTTTEGPITVEVLDDAVALRARAGEWRSLVARSPASSVFQTLEWNSSWWDAFGAGHQLLVLLARVGGELVGIAPLMIAERRVQGRRRRQIEFIGTGSSDYADFIIVAPGREREVLRALLARLGALPARWELLHLLSIPEGSPTPGGLVAYFQRHGYKADRRIAYACPTYLFGDAAADQRLVRKKSLRRHANHYRRTGRLEFRYCATLSEAEGWLEPFFEQHVRRRALTDAPSVFRDERQRAFFRAVARAFLPPEWLRFAVVLHDGRPIAFHFGFEYANKVIWYKPTFDPAQAEHSPGEVLIKYLLEDALDRGVAEFDFTIGEEAFKYRFANHVRHTEVVRVFRRAHSYYLDQVLVAAKARIKRSPALANRGRQVLRLLAARPLGRRGQTT